MRFMQTESVLQTKNRSGPAKIRFSVALLLTNIFSSKFCSKVVFKFTANEMFRSKHQLIGIL